MIEKMDKEPTYILAVKNMLENGKMVNFMGKEPLHMSMELLKKVFGKMAI